MGKVEHYRVNTSGTATKMTLKDGLETATAKYKPPRQTEVLSLPGVWGLPARRIAIYPEASPRPFPLAAGTVALGPDAYRAKDVKNLEGGFWPNMLQRALGLSEKMHVKDWVIIALLVLNLLVGLGGVYLGYKIAKFIHLV